jgi:hypothetical protein
MASARDREEAHSTSAVRRHVQCSTTFCAVDAKMGQTLQQSRTLATVESRRIKGIARDVGVTLRGSRDVAGMAWSVCNGTIDDGFGVECISLLIELLEPRIITRIRI